MAISEIKRIFPSAKLYFFDADGWELQRKPFLHEKVSRFRKSGNCVFLYL